MRLLCAALLVLVCLPAHAFDRPRRPPTPPPAATLTVSVTPTSMAAGSSAVFSSNAQNVTANSCVASSGGQSMQIPNVWTSPAIPLNVTTTLTVTCGDPLVASGTISRSATVTVTGSPPPPPTDTDGDGVPDSSDQCPTQAGPAPTGCPSTPPPPPTEPPPVTDQAIMGPLLNFSETWARNWNFGGHSVDSRFTADYGYWDYTNTTYEPWLFDRATVGYRLFQLTNNTRWRDQFLSDFAWYRQRIDAQGIFTPKGSSDTKYSYITPFLLYERLTSDTQYRSIAQRIYNVWLAEWPNDFNPNAALWTEREVAFALEAAVSWYELTGDSSALLRSRALVNQWSQASGSVGAPLVGYTTHEGGGPGGTTPQNPVNSPWMSALYFQAAERLYSLVGDAVILEQASRYFDWLDVNGLYDGSLAHPEFSGLTFPRYLTGELIGDAGYDEGNMGHALDVAGFMQFAIEAKRARGESTARAEQRLGELKNTALRDFANWTRTTTYLPKYRVTPPRKHNWVTRGVHQLFDVD